MFSLFFIIVIIPINQSINLSLKKNTCNSLKLFNNRHLTHDFFMYTIITYMVKSSDTMLRDRAKICYILYSKRNILFTSFIAEQAKRRGAFLPLMCVNISLYLGVQPRSHDGSLFVVNKVDIHLQRACHGQTTSKQRCINVCNVYTTSFDHDCYNIYFTFSIHLLK